MSDARIIEHQWIKVMGAAMVLMSVLLVGTLAIGVVALLKNAATIERLSDTRRDACAAIVSNSQIMQEAWANAVNRPKVGTLEQQAATQRVNDQLLVLTGQLEANNRALVRSPFCQDYQSDSK